MRYRLDFDVSVLEWLLDGCHPDATARERVNAKVNQALRYVARYGPAVGMPHVRKLKGYQNLYEIRVEDETGWYRIYFGYGSQRPDRETLVALSYAIVKHEREVPERIHQQAARAVVAHLAEKDR